MTKYKPIKSLHMMAIDKTIFGSLISLFPTWNISRSKTPDQIIYRQLFGY
jgi:hypothetical protein